LSAYACFTQASAYDKPLEFKNLISETLNAKPVTASITEGYVPCGDDVIDSFITTAIEDYFQSLSNGERAAFKQRQEFKDKIKDTCLGWSQSPDHEDQERSRDLWARRLIRPLARVALSGDPEQTAIRHISPLNDYWRDIHQKFQDEIINFTRRHEGVLIPFHQNFSQDNVYTEQFTTDDGQKQERIVDNRIFEPMAEVNEFRIYGKTLIRGGMCLQADFIAQHVSRPVV
jgi:hypothetical protein